MTVGGKSDVFYAVVPDGVRASFCEALDTIIEPVSAMDGSFIWARRAAWGLLRNERIDEMERIEPHSLRRGEVLDALRLDHPAFIVERLEFGPDLSVKRSVLAADYKEWRGIKDFSPADMRNLYSLLVYLGLDHNEATKTFHGVRLRK